MHLHLLPVLRMLRVVRMKVLWVLWVLWLPLRLPLRLLPIFFHLRLRWMVRMLRVHVRMMRIHPLPLRLRQVRIHHPHSHRLLGSWWTIHIAGR